jgi:hypothetical protein
MKWFFADKKHPSQGWSSLGAVFATLYFLFWLIVVLEYLRCKNGVQSGPFGDSCSLIMVLPSLPLFLGLSLLLESTGLAGFMGSIDANSQPYAFISTFFYKVFFPILSVVNFFLIYCIGYFIEEGLSHFRSRTGYVNAQRNRRIPLLRSIYHRLVAGRKRS